MSKFKTFLNFALCYLITLASVVPSPITGLAFNLYAFSTFIFLILSIILRANGEEFVLKMLRKAKPDELRRIENSPKRVSWLWLPMVVVMIATGHWIVGIMLFFIWILIYDMMIDAVKKIEERRKSEPSKT